MVAHDTADEVGVDAHAVGFSADDVAKFGIEVGDQCVNVLMC